MDSVYDEIEMPLSTEPNSQDNTLENVHIPSQYPGKGRLVSILPCLVLGTFLVALDSTINSVAIPMILTEFKALNDVGWYGSAYFMCLTAFQTTASKVYKRWPKIAYISSIILFEGRRCVIFPLLLVAYFNSKPALILDGIY